MRQQLATARPAAARGGMAALLQGAPPARPPQRLACACGGSCPRCSQPGEATERQAERRADVLAPTLPVLPASASGAALPAAARQALEPGLGGDLSAVRLHHDAPAQARSAGLGARAFTQGKDIYFGAGEYAPASARGRHLLTHELAHTLQPGAQGRIARKTLTDLSAGARQTLQVSRTAPAPADVAAWINKYFDPQGGASATPGLALEWGTEIADATLQKNLGAIVFELLSVSQAAAGTVADPENWPLGPNSLLDLALDLRAWGGEHAVFRFTRHSDGGSDVVLVERLRVLAAAGSTAAAVPALTGTHTGSVAVGAIHVQIDPGFGNDRGKAIADAVALLPATLRSQADGLRFVDGGSGQGPGGEKGHYDPLTDAVSLYGDLFAASPRQVGMAGNSAYLIVHEIGHAVDLRPLFVAQRARDAAVAAKKKLEAPKPISADSLGDPLAEGGPTPAEKLEIARLQKEIDTQGAAIAGAKSIAGSEIGTLSESMLTDFAKALAADGVKAVKNGKQSNAATEAANIKAQEANEANPTGPQKAIQPMVPLLSTGVSRYAATDLMEAYAENYALYVLDDTLLLALRPKTHAYFTKALPKTAPQPKP